MAEGTIRIELDPKQVQELRDFVREQLRQRAGQPGPPPGMEPITMRSHEGDRVLFVSETGETIWVRSTYVTQAELKGCRMAWARKA